MSKQILQLFSTQNLKVASVLTALGFNFENDAAPVTRVSRQNGNESTVFWFHALHPTTGQTADQVNRWMTVEGDDFCDKNPEHPVAYMRAALMNRDELVGVVKRTPRMCVIERNGKTIAISEHATDEDKKRFAKFL
jgi:hypothetical protein